jgi:23S rRNA pseudoU1915 N3-methylase RlmH
MLDSKGSNFDSDQFFFTLDSMFNDEISLCLFVISAGDTGLSVSVIAR